MALEVRLEHVSVGCNRTPHCVDWNVGGLLAYGADKSIALATDSSGGRGPEKVVATLHGHKERVNCVRWISHRQAQRRKKQATAQVSDQASVQSSDQTEISELVSGAVDKNVIVWRKKDTKFSAVQTLSAHTAPVTCLAAIYLLARSDELQKGEAPTINTLIASGSSDSSVIIWERKGYDSQFCAMQTISFGRGFALGLDFYLLPGTEEPVFACGGDDTKVNLFIRQDGKFVREQSLSGHEDWIRDLHFTHEASTGDLLLASCSQDTYIRLWRVGPERRSQGVGSGKEDEGELKLTGNLFSVLIGQEEHRFAVTLESVLMGHEDWVYSVQWQPSSADHTLCLLSASMDKTMTLWQPDPASGVWLEQVRVGEVGGNTLGLYGGVFGPRGDLILAHGYQGAFHLWKRVATETRTDQSDGLELWQPLPTLSGHFGPVQDISWEPGSGRFVVSVSSDQTVRLHAPWIRDGRKTTWHEIARPQIHGYDMQSIAMTTSLQYVSGADEKVLRVFEAPSNFLSNLLRISKIELTQGVSELPLGASVPSLGLSNKAVFTYQEVLSVKEGEEPVSKNLFADHISPFTPANLSEPPVEEHLLQNALWPETQKLYGHGYEIYCIASSPDAKFVASACKATKQEHASIRVWETSSWRQVATLTSHTLTVTQLMFSHSGLHLLAVSRDRCWSLWQQTEGKEEALFRLSAQTDKTSRSHGRIIWGCSWASDDSCFATGSRDKKVFLWSQHGAVEGARDCGDGWRVASEALECAHAVTAVDFAPCVLQDKRHILAVGLESGEIMVYTCRLNPPEWSLTIAVDPVVCHTSTVKRLQWRPQGDKGDKDDRNPELTLASCGQDHAIRLFSVALVAA